LSYTIKLISPAEREAVIGKGVGSSTRTEDFYDFRSAKYSLKVIRVPIDIPVYRMENFRTFTDQHEYLAKEKKAQDFFQRGQELESVQQIQHNLLARLARKGIADSVVPVIDVLEKDGQREALLVTASGVVVNGNRRLAAMRELFTEPASNPSFSHVDVMVLPADASVDEIVDIEASLQARPETKLDYDWVGDAQLISRLVGMGRSFAEVAERLNRNEKDIKNAIRALAEADLYLKEWAHAEGEYSRVREDAEQLFKDLPKRLDGKPAALEEASRVIAWSLFENREKLPGRLYNFNAAFGHLAADVLERAAADLGLATVEADPLVELEDDDSFSIDVDAEAPGEGGVVSYDAVIEALKDEATKDDAIDALIDAAEAAMETEKGQKSGQAAIKTLAQAHTKLAAVDLTRATRETYAGIGKQLEAIDKLVKRLAATFVDLKG
jgi:hypothetical protein